MFYRTISLEFGDDVAELTLSRPEKLNAFTAEMHEELRDAMTKIETSEGVRCLLITGEGRGFCSGQDLSDRVADTPDQRRDVGASLEANYNALVKRLADLPFPVVVAVNGVAAGAGASLALTGDLVLCARSARFIQSFSRIGLIPDAGGTWILPRLAGHGRAMAMAMLAEPVSAEQADAWGMVYKVVDDDALMDEARTLARTLATRPTVGLGLLRKAMRASLDNDFETQLALEASLQREAGYTDDYQEGIKAFLDKREPNFQGK